MAPDEHIRNEVHNRLAEAIGSDAAAYVMTHLPPEDWPELATKADLRAFGIEIHKDMAHMAELFATRFDAVATRFDAVDQRFDAVDQRFDSMEQRFDANMRAVVANSTAALRKEIVVQTRTMIIALATIMVALVAAIR